MRTKEFLSKLDHDRIVSAIQQAEAQSSGEIRVYVQRGLLRKDALDAAQKKFQKLKMHRTQEQNAVLIFIAPRARKVAIVGDRAIHEKCGEQFWRQIVDSMRVQLQRENFTGALVEAIDETGKLLAAHFPKTPTDSNELRDRVIEH